MDQGCRTQRCRMLRPKAEEPRAHLAIVARGMWGARPPSAVKLLKKPAANIFYELTYTPPCRKLRFCSNDLRKLQNRMMNINKYEDIPYNFMLGGDGRVYEGRGWGVRPILPKEYTRYARKSIFIAFMAPSDDERCLEMQDAKFDLVDYGIAEGHIDPDYLIYDVRKDSYV